MQLSGKVTSAGVGLSNWQVSLCQAGPERHTILDIVTTDSNGNFTLSFEPNGSGVYFLWCLARDHGWVQYLSILGPTLPSQSVVVNELTTVGAVYAAQQFMNGQGYLSGDQLGLEIAYLMSRHVADPLTGDFGALLNSSPNAQETNARGLVASLGNLIASIVASPDIAWWEWMDQAVVGNPVGHEVTGLLTALAKVAKNPSYNASATFAQSAGSAAFSDPLYVCPDAWTLALKFNGSGSPDHLFGGPGNVAFDNKGYVWIANNVVQGTPNSTPYSIVLKPDGTPADGTDGSPTSPFTGDNLLGPGFGVTVDNNQNQKVWYGNFGWGDGTVAPGQSVSCFNATNGSPAFDGNESWLYADQVQGIMVDPGGNLWVAGFGSNNVVRYEQGQPNSAQAYDCGDGFLPFGIVMDQSGVVWVTDSAAKNSRVIRLKYENGTFQYLSSTRIGQVLKGIGIDSMGNAWIASGGDSKVYFLNSQGVVLDSFSGGGMTGPWGLTIDKDDHVWVGNFGPLRPGSIHTGRLTRLAGANPNTRPYGFVTGQPMSPSSGYTLPSGGSQVLLANEDQDPLYGAGADPCYIPMMRTTGVEIDRAGNVWVCNNWKPSFDVDITTNPGGDGMVVFLGMGSV